MPKDLTEKDVLYALEYLGDVLVRTPINASRSRWQLRSGALVKDAVAHAVRMDGRTYSVEDLGRQIVRWRAAA